MTRAGAPVLLRRHRARSSRPNPSTSSIVFRASRYGKGTVTTTSTAPSTATSTRPSSPRCWQPRRSRRATSRRRVHFEGCLPIEELAARGEMTLRLRADEAGRPARSAHRPGARTPWCSCARTTAHATLYNLVGFQTKLTWPEQRRDLPHAPGAGAGPSSPAWGHAPQHLHQRAGLPRLPTLQLRRIRACSSPGRSPASRATWSRRPAASSPDCSRPAAASASPSPPPPPTTGARRPAQPTWPARPPQGFQPMNVTYGLFPPLEGRQRKSPPTAAWPWPSEPWPICLVGGSRFCKP
ncbi:MAG: hypothetical protein MZW92_43685 [Comamonadaceae bacterium]|nr:hypothetical protein [Comamonadaceae bacterium]